MIAEAAAEYRTFFALSPRLVVWVVAEFLAVQAWDGGNGEQGLMMALSSWNFVLLDAPAPRGAYLAHT